jgi:cob(I)alamin adenosyltransferase
VRIYTKTGDEGTTGLLYGGRISKADPAAEAYGSVDEAVASLGMARALIPNRDTAELVLRLQRDLFVVAADLATNPRERGKLKPGVSLATRDMSEGLEPLIDQTAADHPLSREFVVPGVSPASAALDVARTAVRRAERRAVELREAGGTVTAEVLLYLNRLSDLLFVMARALAEEPEEPSRGGRGT